MFLAQTGGFLGPLAKVMGYILNFIYTTLGNIGIGNLGLSIILFAIFARLILFPLTVKQQKSAKINQALQPELNKIMKKYKGKKDQDSMMQQNMEMQAVYKKYGVSQTGGCLSMLIQLPIMYALYRVIYNIPAYIPTIKQLYQPIADKMVKYSVKYETEFKQIATSVKYTITDLDVKNKDELISLMGKFKPDTWEQVKQIFHSHSDVVNAINANYNDIVHANSFVFGINLSDYPFTADHRFSIYLLIPIAAAFFQFLQTKTMQMGNDAMKDNPANNMMKYMTITMPLMSLFFYSVLPSAIGLYWAATALFTVIQQLILNYYFSRKDMDEIIAKQVEKASKKKRKSFMERIMEMEPPEGAEAAKNNMKSGMSNNKSSIAGKAKMSTKKIDTSNIGNVSKNNTVEDKESVVNQPPKGSIAAKANMLLNYEDNKKGGK